MSQAFLIALVYFWFFEGCTLCRLAAWVAAKQIIDFMTHTVRFPA